MTAAEKLRAMDAALPEQTIHPSDTKFMDLRAALPQIVAVVEAAEKAAADAFAIRTEVGDLYERLNAIHDEFEGKALPEDVVGEWIFLNACREALLANQPPLPASVGRALAALDEALS